MTAHNSDSLLACASTATSSCRGAGRKAAGKVEYERQEDGVYEVEEGFFF